MKFTKIFMSGLLALCVSNQLLAGSIPEGEKVSINGYAAKSMIQALENTGVKGNNFVVGSIDCFQSVAYHPVAHCTVYSDEGTSMQASGKDSMTLFNILGMNGAYMPTGYGVRRASVVNVECSVDTSVCSFNKFNLKVSPGV